MLLTALGELEKNISNEKNKFVKKGGWGTQRGSYPRVPVDSSGCRTLDRGPKFFA